MDAMWDDDRHLPRASYIIPCALHDTATTTVLKSVMLDLSAEGCRVFTNDRRVRLMDKSTLVGKTFRVEFDFYDVDTGTVQGQVVNVSDGKDAANERQMGLKFVGLDPDVARAINRIVSRARSK